MNRCLFILSLFFLGACGKEDSAPPSSSTAQPATAPSSQPTARLIEVGPGVLQIDEAWAEFPPATLGLSGEDEQLVATFSAGSADKEENSIQLVIRIHSSDLSKTAGEIERTEGVTEDTGEGIFLKDGIALRPVKVKVEFDDGDGAVKVRFDGRFQELESKRSRIVKGVIEARKVKE